MWAHHRNFYESYENPFGPCGTFQNEKQPNGHLKTLLVTKHPDGKFLIIVGCIASFTDAAATLTVLIKALEGLIIGVEGAQHQDLDFTSWLKLPQRIAQD